MNRRAVALVALLGAIGWIGWSTLFSPTVQAPVIAPNAAASKPHIAIDRRVTGARSQAVRDGSAVDPSPPATSAQARYGSAPIKEFENLAQMRAELGRLIKQSENGDAAAAFALAQQSARCHRLHAPPPVWGKILDSQRSDPVTLCVALNAIPPLGNWADKTHHWLDRASDLGSVVALSAYTTIGMYRYTLRPQPLLISQKPMSADDAMFLMHTQRVGGDLMQNLTHVIRYRERASALLELARQRGDIDALRIAAIAYGDVGPYPHDPVRAHANELAMQAFSAQVPSDARGATLRNKPLGTGLSRLQREQAQRLAERYIAEIRAGRLQ